jgi:methylmalonyl-CoA mutase N-terminal domain/subunit
MSDGAPTGRSWLAETGFEIEPLYEGEGATTLGRPGEFPFTRHIYPTGYRERAWAPSLYSGFGTPEDANRRFRYLLEQGNGRANVATDLPTQIGLDSDDPLAAGEVGRVGVAVDSLADFELMFEGVPLDRTPVSFNINTVAPIFVAMLVATAKRQGVPARALTGTVANDILHEYVCRGTWRYPPDASLRLMGDLAEYSVRELPKFYPWNIRSILLHESGANPAQEIGITFAIACRYVDEVLARGIPIDEFAPRMSFFFGVGLHFLEEAAKFRAARRLWATIMRDRYGAESPSSQKLRITSVAPCGSHFTAQDPELNLVRGTLGVLSGALGGVQAMLGTTIDEAYDIPTERTQHLALRTQQVVALESDVCATVDPLGGSYFVEALTDRIEQAAREEIERLGGSAGVVDAIVAGRPQADLAERAYQLELEAQRGERKIVGVNVYPTAPAADLHLHRADPALHERRSRELAELRARRDGEAVGAAVERLTRAAAARQNVMPYLVDAVEVYATVGELSVALERVFGEYRQPVAV